MNKKKNKAKSNAKAVLMVAFFVMIVLAVVFALIVILGSLKWNEVDNGNGEWEDKNTTAAPTSEPTETDAPENTEDNTAEPTAAPTADPVTYKDYTLTAGGDILLHMGLQESALKTGGGSTYDFSEITKYVSSYLSSKDYTVLNFEGTLAGTSVKYSSYPRFNAPDSILTTMKSSGVDMMLFANNHAYDTDHAGLVRTMQQFAANGFDYIGARTSESEKSYGVFKVGDVSVGMLNYTYESPPDYELTNKAAKFINGIRLELEDIPLIDSFNYNWLEDFYTEAEARIAEMKANGASVIICFMHWGEEYENVSNETQRVIAQKLCDIGVDAIIGGHPHVVQETNVITSSDGTRNTIVYYSVGNFISNQNRSTFTNNYERGVLTENGLLATLTLRQYSTGEAQIVSCSYMPIWVYRYETDGNTVFNVIPLTDALASDTAKASYGLTSTTDGVKNAQTACDYITSLVNAGVTRFNNMVKLLYPDAAAEK